MRTATTSCRWEAKTMNIMTGPDETAVEPRRKRAPNDRALTFRQRDLVEAIKGARKAGLDMNKYRVTVGKSGTIRLVPMAPGESAEPKGANTWDEVLQPGYKPKP